MLALAWLGVLVPAVLRARRSDPLSSSERFRISMNMISPSGGRYVILPQGDRRPSTAYRRALIERRRMQRRRRTFAILLALSAVTAISALAGGPAGIELHLVADLVLALYVTFLVEARRRRVERTSKVRRIDNARSDRRLGDSDVQFHEPVRRRA